MRYDVGRFRRPMRRGVMEQMVSLISLGDGSTLTLDFTTGVLDSRLTFTRASDATFINSSGLVQYADANHVRNSTMLVSTLWTQTTTGTGATTINGDGSVRFNGAGGRVTWLQSVALAAGLQTTFSFRVTAFTNTDLRTSDLFFSGFGFTGQQYFYTDENGTTHSLTAFESLPKTGTNGRGVYSCTATTTGTSCNVIFGADCNGVGRLGDVTIRDPQVQYGTVVPRRAYVPNSSTISAKWDSARFDHDPITRAPRGLLIEGQATNICLNGSMAYTATAPTSWTRGFSGCTVASVDSTTFAGQKAWSISATASGQRDLLEQVIALAANTTYTVSVYLEAVTGTVATFAYMTSLPAGATSNTVVNPSAGRISFTVTVAATAGNGTLRIGIGTATGTGVSADASVRFSHVQVETGEGASSYIPTGASQATRVADSCVMTGTNFSSWFAGATEGVLYAECERPTKIPSPATDHAIVGTRYANGQGLWIYASATNQYPSAYIFPTGGAQFAGGIATRISLINKQAVRWFDGNDITNFGNGTQGTTNTAGTGTMVPTMLTIGANSTSGTEGNLEWLNGCIRRVKFWPTALPNAQIIALTT